MRCGRASWADQQRLTLRRGAEQASRTGRAGHAKQAGRREREGQLLAGLPAGQAGVWAEKGRKEFLFQIFFFLFCFQSQFKSKPIVNLNRVLNILFISNIIEQFW